MFIEAASLALRLEAIEQVGRRIKILRFVSAAGATLPAAAPGAHFDIEIESGLVRQYSLVEIDAAARQYAIAVLHQPEGRGGSKALHGKAKIGGIFKASLPRNHFPLSAEPGETVLFGGGIGVTPLLPMFRALKARGEPVRLFYWARNTEDFLFREMLREDPAVRLFATASEAAPRIADLLPEIPLGARLYCCGPEAMLRAFAEATKQRRPELLNIERFTPAPARNGEADAAFTVELRRQSRILEIPCDKSILQVCLDEGIDIPFSCEEGVCGACEARVLEGAVSHRDSVLPAATHERQGTMMLCCSRALGGTLVLDI